MLRVPSSAQSKPFSFSSLFPGDKTKIQSQRRFLQRKTRNKNLELLVTGQVESGKIRKNAALLCIISQQDKMKKKTVGNGMGGKGTTKYPHPIPLNKFEVHV